MAKKRLVQLGVDRLRPPAEGRVEYWDSHLPAFGLRVYASGRKSWVVMYRVRGSRQQHRLTWNVDDIPNVADARARALAALEAARKGIDPRPVAKAGDEQPAADDSVAAVVGRFIREHVERKCRPSTVAEYRRMFDREIIPHWGDRPLATIARPDVNALLDTKAVSYPLQANELRKRLRTLFRWCVDMDLIGADPTAGTRLRANPVARDRVLSDREISLFWRAAGGLGWPFGPIARLLLLTAQRRDEVGAARWSEFDFARRLWTIPGTRAKNGRQHEVQLSAQAEAILEGLPRLGELLFSSTGTTAPSGYSRAKCRLDRLIAGHAAGVPIPTWTLHDLRRTAASGMARMGVLPHVVDKILNHASGEIRGVAAVYNRFQYGEERAAALDLWGDRVARLVSRADVERLEAAE